VTGALAAPAPAAHAASFASCELSLTRAADAYEGLSVCAGSLGGASIMPTAGGALLRVDHDRMRPCMLGSAPAVLELASPKAVDVFQTDTVATEGRLELMRAGDAVTVRGAGWSEGDAVTFTGTGTWRGGGCRPDELELVLEVVPGTGSAPAGASGDSTFAPSSGTAARPRALRLTVAPRRVVRGRATRVRFLVRDAAGVAQRGAQVRFAGRRLRTDARGRASLRYVARRRGPITVRATKPGFREASALLRTRARR
jgi:hypothetical protein